MPSNLLFSSKNIQIKTQRLPFSPLSTTIPIRLFKLIYSTATVHTRRQSPTWRMKIKEKDDLLEYIDPASPDLILLKSPDPEINTRNSADMGVGVAACVIDHFYKIRWATLSRIVSAKSRPDFTVHSGGNKSIVVEAKGTGYLQHHRTQKKKAAKQKWKLQADINLSSCTLFSNSKSEVVLRDPPAGTINDPKQNYLLQKADHYCRAMNLIGQKELSEYFDLMRKRILYDKDFAEYPIKEDLYRKIKGDYVTVHKNGRTYRGAVKRIAGESIVFCGVDDDLISLQHFKDFRNYGEDSFQQDGDNTFCSFRDGVCLFYVEDMERETALQHEIGNQRIPNYQDETVLDDVKSMSEYGLTEFFKYLMEKSGGRISYGLASAPMRPDLVVSFDSAPIPCEIKKRFSRERFIRTMLQLQDFAAVHRTRSPVLIIADYVPEEFHRIATDMGVLLIDLFRISEILREHSRLKRFMMA